MTEIRFGPQNMDFDSVTAMLERAYWSPGIKREEVVKAAENSTVVAGVFVDGQQIGYCRALSDKTRFAYIMDVIVEEGKRGAGAAKQMLEAVLAHSELKDVYQWLLITRDAHGFYERCGFSRTARPDDWMEIKRDRPKR